ncbi:MAG: HNH endonuclease [Sedimentisphaerales bacterium]|nr:HNH endonuclease [Sedimentisphaerales bacterium]
MARERNTTVGGAPFNETVIGAVWEKAAEIKGKDPTDFRRDILSNEICRNSYGKHSIMGWEIDHIKPVSKGGTDAIDNLQALQSAANSIKGDNYPWP